MMTENSDSFEPAPIAREVTSVSSPTEMRPPINGPRRMSNPALTLRNFTANNPELQQVTAATAAKIDSLKKWTVSTYKNTKHLCMEQMGKLEKTVDKELEERIDGLRDLKKCYLEVLSTANHFSNYMAMANNMQRSMANAFCELASKETTIAKELNLQSELLGLMAQNNEPLQRNLSLFISSLQTLTDSTIEDTFMTIENHDKARLEFDVSRQELQNARENPASTAETIAELQEETNRLKLKYEQLKEDVRAKMVLLEENRCRVLRKQIQTLQDAFAVCYMGGAQAVERTTGEFAKLGLANDHRQGSSLQSSNSTGLHSFLEK